MVSKFLPSKLKILVRKVAWNYLPHCANLVIRRLRTDSICPQCGDSFENSDHVFRFCPTSQKVWEQLQLEWVLSNQDGSMWDWLTWTLDSCSSLNRRLRCCALWSIWLDRNKGLHEGKRGTRLEIALFVEIYVSFIDACDGKPLTRSFESCVWEPPQGTMLKINFDAAFDRSRSIFAFGIVVRDAQRDTQAMMNQIIGQ